ncbi:MAG: GyrI-like domain-containing protein [bacterium]|nr:GyrI-like domain-containing protein [bacterium]
MSKVDLKHDYIHLYNAPKKDIGIVDVPPFNFLMIDGTGDPNTSAWFQEAVEALYGVSFTLKFMVKKQNPDNDYVVMPLEGLWWMEGEEGFDPDRRDDWQWTLMIMQPPFVTADLIDEAVAQVRAKKGLSALDKLRFENFYEGLSVQIMHIGPYSEEGPTIARMFDFMRLKGYRPRGRHHEIYLSDPRKAVPEKMKTIIRHPVA